LVGFFVLAEPFSADALPKDSLPLPFASGEALLPMLPSSLWYFLWFVVFTATGYFDAHWV
jgi:hypothetical protein